LQLQLIIAAHIPVQSDCVLYAVHSEIGISGPYLFLAVSIRVFGLASAVASTAISVGDCSVCLICLRVRAQQVLLGSSCEEDRDFPATQLHLMMGFHPQVDESTSSC
jgi:hypothetical protein